MNRSISSGQVARPLGAKFRDELKSFLTRRERKARTLAFKAHREAIDRNDTREIGRTRGALNHAQTMLLAAERKLEWL